MTFLMDLATALGFVVIAALLAFAVVGVLAFVQRRRGGFPHTRARWPR